jgi:hypothetical protein
VFFGALALVGFGLWYKHQFMGKKPTTKA